MTFRARCREFVVPFWPGKAARILVCETDNRIPYAIERPVLIHSERTPLRYPLLPFQNQRTSTLLSPQSILRGVTSQDAAAVEAQRLQGLDLAGASNARR